MSKCGQRGARTARGAHFSELGLLSRALYLSGTPSDVSTTSTSVKMVITFSKGEKDTEKEGFSGGLASHQDLLRAMLAFAASAAAPIGSQGMGRDGFR